MTKDDVLRMAQEAGFVVDEKAQQHQPNCIFHTHHMVDELLERFAALVASELDIHWHKIVHDECEAAIKEEREAILQMSAENWYKTQNDYDDAIRQRNNQ